MSVPPTATVPNCSVVMSLQWKHGITYCAWSNNRLSSTMALLRKVFGARGQRRISGPLGIDCVRGLSHSQCPENTPMKKDRTSIDDTRDAIEQSRRLIAALEQ